MSKKPVKYINNRDLLIEIHKSKNSYSSFSSPDYNTFDIILDDIANINQETIDAAKQNKAKRLSIRAFEDAKLTDPTVKLADVEVDPSTFSTDELIFRIMTFDHIPDAPGRKKSIKSIADTKERVNFPPFIHVKLTTDGELQIVGKSHWKGDINEGKFSCTHGQMTNDYALMLMKLCEKYTSRGNLRKYTYTDEMQSEAILQLTQAGLKFNEFKSDNPFSFLTTTIHNAVLRVLNAEKNIQNIRDDLLEFHDLNPSYTRTIDNEFESDIRRELDL